MCVTPEFILEQRKKNEQIEEQLRAEAQLAETEIKMLLLGTGESGKSTILKQMVLLYGKGYSDQDKKEFRTIIYSNIILGMKALFDAMKVLRIEVQDENLKGCWDVILIQDKSKDFSSIEETTVKEIRKLWDDSGVQACVARKSEFQFTESTIYFISEIDRIGSPSYTPDEQDILRSRAKTVGISETVFELGKLTYRLYDVGGQRNERKKWIHCFSNVTAVVFLAAISEFDQVLAEDETKNRAHEALTVFDEICNNPFFFKTSIILFLNKKDLLQKKLESNIMLNKYFPEYKGDNSYASVCDFIRDAFVSLNQSDEKQVYHHFTCATDTGNVKIVMKAVTDVIVRTQLSQMGFI